MIAAGSIFAKPERRAGTRYGLAEAGSVAGTLTGTACTFTKASTAATAPSQTDAFGLQQIFDGLVFDDDQSLAVCGALGLWLVKRCSRPLLRSG
jgi:hypothetical protein